MLVPPLLIATLSVLYECFVHGIVERIVVQVEDHEVADLDELARQERRSRSAIVREAIALLLAERRRRREFGQVIASYTAEPHEGLQSDPAAVRRAWPD